MDPTFASAGDGASIHQVVEDLLGERIEALAGWIQELDAQVRATSAAGDEKTLKELRRALEAWSKRDPKFEERLTDRVDVLADRLATLSSTVNTTASAHAGSDGEIASLRRELEQETANLHAALRETGPSVSARELDELRKAIAELARGAPQHGDPQTADVRARVENLRERVDVLAKTVATTAAGLAGREGDLAALRKTFEEEGERVEQRLATLRRETAGPGLARLEDRIAALTESLAAVTGSIAEREREATSLRASIEEQSATVDALASALRDSTEAFDTRLAALADERGAVAAVAALEERVGELDERRAAVDSRFDDLDARFDSVSAAVADASAGSLAHTRDISSLRQRLEETGTRFESALAEVRTVIQALPQQASLAELDSRLVPVQAQVEQIGERALETGALVTGIKAEWDEERARVREQLDELAAAVAETAPRTDVEALVGEVSSRLQELELEHTALTTEVAHTGETFMAAHARLETALRQLPQPVAPIPPSEDEQLERLLTAFADRIDAMERERAAIPAETAKAFRSELDARFDELAARIDAFDDRPVPAPSSGLLPGDGRLRVELRALELRMQHAEAAARENREAVLVQLERLASRIEWRLQRLEADEAAEAQETGEEQALGQVVPIRGGAET